jgi:uncharacterized membrane protein
MTRISFLTVLLKSGTVAAAVLLVCGLPLCAQQADSPSRQCLGRRCSMTKLLSRHHQPALGEAQTSQPLSQVDDNATYVTFDPPGSTNTGPSAITAAGVIIGSYIDASGLTHGFLRTVGGTYTVIDVPGASLTMPTAINPGGVITGWYCNVVSNGFCSSTSSGFVRARDGTLTTFNLPGGGFVFPLYNPFGPPPSINPAGEIAGTYFDPNFAGEHGFLRTPDGTLSTIDAPGAFFTEVLAINPAGVIVGDLCDAATCFRGFVRAPDGTFTQIGPPGANVETIPIGGINPSGAVTGTYYDGVNLLIHGYLLTPDGTFTVFDPPGSVYTSPFAINPAGVITGYYCDAVGCRSFLRAPDGTITSFDPPGSVFSVALAINSGGVVTGSFQDASGVEHGFVYRP